MLAQAFARNHHKARRTVFLFFVFCIFSLPFIQNSNAASGKIDGHFAVNNSGAATYSIPLKLPIGVGGLSPDLTLTYHSQRGDGSMGVGWNLSGLSKIHRCRPKLAVDTVVDNVDMDENDRFCMDGARLVPLLTSVTEDRGACNDGSFGRQYRTEIDNQSRIVACGAIGELPTGTHPVGINPEYFIVWSRKGLKKIYGGSAETRIRTYGRIKGTDSVLFWLLDTVSDNKKNYYAISYNKDITVFPSNPGLHVPSANIEYVPNIIQYGGNTHTGLAHSRVIKFEYLDAPVNTDRPNRYSLEAALTTNKYLSRISTYIEATVTAPTVLGANVTGQNERQYTFGYETSLLTNRMLLNSVEECGWDIKTAVFDCLPATVFDWPNESNPVITKVVANASNLGAGSGAGLNMTYPVIVMDFNGDGHDDFFGLVNDFTGGLPPIQEYRVYLGRQDGDLENTGNLTNDEYISFDLNAAVPGFVIPDKGFFRIDYNSDGKDDIIGAFCDTTDAQSRKFDCKWLIFVSDGQTFTKVNGTILTADENPFPITPGSTTHGLARAAYVADINGDGREDLLQSDRNDLRVRLNSSSGFALDVPTLDPSGTTLINTGINDIRFFPVYTNKLDFNGDGREDLMIEGISDCTFYMSTSQGNNVSFEYVLKVERPDELKWNGDPDWIPTYYCQPIKPIDVNGDGNTDWAFPSFDVDTGAYIGWSIYLSASVGIGKVIRTNILTASQINSIGGIDYSGEAWARVIDYNGDGRQDIIVPNAAYTEWVILKSTGENFQLIQTGIPFNPNTPLNNLNGYVADFRGDGTQSFLFIEHNLPNDVWVSIGLNNSPDEDSITSILKGGGDNVSINYDPITIREDLNELKGVYSNSNILPEPTSNTLVRDFLAPIYVVNTYWEKDKSFTFRYGGSKYDRGRQNFLGFNWIMKIDHSTGGSHDPSRYTQTYFHQIFPKTGLIREQYSKFNSVGLPVIGEGPDPAIILKKTVNNWASRSTATEILNPNSNFLFLKDQVTDIYELDGRLVSTTETTYLDSGGFDSNGYDKYGNPEKINVVSKLGLNEDDRQTSVFEYTPIITDTEWIPGLLSHSDVTGVRPGQPSKKKMTGNSYYPSGTTDVGFLYCEIIEPGAATGQPAQEIKNCFTYDDYGYLATASATGFDGDFDDAGLPLNPQTKSTRTTQYRYDFFNTQTQKITIINPENHIEIKMLDMRYGNEESSHDQDNNLTTTVEYDAFGRPVKETMDDGTYVVTRYSDKSDSLCLPPINSCPLGTEFIITTQNFSSSGDSIPPEIMYLDRFDRELRVEFPGFRSSTKIFRDTTYKTPIGVNYDRGIGQIDTVTRNYMCDSSATPPITHFEYDDLDRIKITTVPDTSTITMTYPGATAEGIQTTEAKLRISGTDIVALFTHKYRNSLGQIVKAIDHDSSKSDFMYDAIGNLTQTIDNVGNVTNILYDQNDNRSQIDDPDMGTWKYRYNAFGELKWQKDAKQQMSRVTYDNIGRIKIRVEPWGTSTWVYDTSPIKGVGRLHTLNGPDNYSEEYLYDVKGRLSKTNLAFDAANYSVSTDYDDFSRVNAISNSENNSLVYRQLQRYGFTGYLNSICDGTHTTSDVCNAGSSEIIWLGAEANADLNITQETLGNAVNSRRGYNYFTGLLDTIRTGTTSSDTNIQHLQYRFDSLGNLTNRSDFNLDGAVHAGQTESFTYDNLNRLESTSFSGVTTTFQYDSIGNIEYKSDVGYYKYGENGAGPHAVTSVRSTPLGSGGAGGAGDANGDGVIDALDVLVAVDAILERNQSPAANSNCNGVSGVDVTDVVCITNKITNTTTGIANVYSYNANGSMVSGAGRSIDYTSFNKPVNVSSSDAVLSFDYNSNHNRIVQKRITSKGQRVIHYINKQFEKIKNEEGDILYENYVMADNRLVAMVTKSSTLPNELKLVHSDHLGSSDVQTKKVGSSVEVIERFSYNSFGERRSATYASSAITSLKSDDMRRGFTGHEELDDVGFVHMNARLYDPLIGRFISPDPVTQFPESTQGLNRYTYVNNNPLSFTDPSGNFFGLDCGGRCNGEDGLIDVDFSEIARRFDAANFSNDSSDLGNMGKDFCKNGDNCDGNNGVLRLAGGNFQSEESLRRAEIETKERLNRSDFDVAMDAIDTVDTTLTVVGGAAIASGVGAPEGFGLKIIGTMAVTGAKELAGKIFTKGGKELVDKKVARGAGKSLKDQAADLIPKNANKNRVTLRSPNQKMEVDLAGRTHGNVPTPHTKVSPRNLKAPNQPAFNTKNSPIRPATQQDIRTVRRFRERQERQ